MISKLVSIQTEKHSSLINITAFLQSFLTDNGLSEGLCTVFVPHTTCGITINENADPDVKSDILMELDRIVPLTDGYRHGEGNSAAHIKASFMGSSVTIPVLQGCLALGIWQGVYLCEFDGPRTRNVRISFISG